MWFVVCGQMFQVGFIIFDIGYVIFFDQFGYYYVVEVKLVGQFDFVCLFWILKFGIGFWWFGYFGGVIDDDYVVIELRDEIGVLQFWGGIGVIWDVCCIQFGDYFLFL